MGLVWRERDGSLDAGVDGAIELRDPETGEMFNRFVLVQSKASDRPFAGEGQGSDTFHLLCERRHIDYWMGSDDPVIVVCSHPKSGEAWWTHVQECFADPQRRAARRLDFDKRTHIFDKTARSSMLDLAKASRAGYTPRAERLPETLESNLLEVRSVPSIIFRAPCDCRKPREVYEQLRQTDVELRHDWVLYEGNLYSFTNPEECGLGTACGRPVDVLGTDDWAHSDDENVERQFVALLNKSLRQMTAEDLEWHDGRRKYLYFKAPKNRRQRQLPTGKNTLRTVFMPKGKYYWHAAMSYRFIRVDTTWYLAIVPTYHYTYDGERESQFASDYLAKIKRVERDRSVLGFTRMWATFLRADHDGALFERANQLIEFGDLATFAVDRGIDDLAWAAASSLANLPDDDFDLFTESYEDIDT